MSQRLVAPLVALMLIAGCGGSNHPLVDPKTALAAPDTQPAATQPAAQNPDILAMGALAAKAEASAAEMQQRPPAIPRLATPDPVAPPVRPITPPEVKLDLNNYQLHLGPPQDPSGPAPSHDQVVQTTAMAVSLPQPVKAALPTPPSLLTADELEAKLARQLKDSPRDPATALDYQLLHLLRGQLVPQEESLTGLSREDREAVSALMDAINLYRSTVRGDGTLPYNKKIRPLVDLSDRLRTRTDLTIRSMVLCSSVARFGVYEPLPSNRFIAGREQMAVLYCHVENFSSRLNDRQQWETNTACDVVLYDQRSHKVWSDKRLQAADLSRNRRHDYSLARMITLPASLPGQYTLKATVTDQQAGRVDESDLGIEIVPGQ